MPFVKHFFANLQTNFAQFDKYQRPVYYIHRLHSAVPPPSSAGRFSLTARPKGIVMTMTITIEAEIKQIIEQRQLTYAKLAADIRVDTTTLWRWVKQPERSNLSVRQAQAVAVWAMDNDEPALARAAGLYLLGERARDIIEVIEIEDVAQPAG